MNILALDSSSTVVSIALLDHRSSSDSRSLFQYHRQQTRTNSSIFFEGLQTVLQQYKKPDRIVVGLGPGSYNGLRASIAAAQGIASACHLELIGLPSILGLQPVSNEIPGNYENGFLARGAAPFWAMGDARGGQYWLAAISEHQLLEAPFLLAPADLPHHLKRHPHFSLITSQELPHLPSSIKVTIKTPDALILARLGADAKGTTSLEPLYLKEPHITMSRP